MDNSHESETLFYTDTIDPVRIERQILGDHGHRRHVIERHTRNYYPAGQAQLRVVDTTVDTDTRTWLTWEAKQTKVVKAVIMHSLDGVRFDFQLSVVQEKWDDAGIHAVMVNETVEFKYDVADPLRGWSGWMDDVALQQPPVRPRSQAQTATEQPDRIPVGRGPKTYTVLTKAPPATTRRPVRPRLATPRAIENAPATSVRSRARGRGRRCVIDLEDEDAGVEAGAGKEGGEDDDDNFSDSLFVSE